ncbi:MAG: prepilin-type N-terminal cleavage/methylation domain-containing protein, partial [Planctomycetota bacterium]
MRARPGFTLIELSMAMVIGLIVVFAAISMFQTIQRADAIADVRAEEIYQLRRSQAVVSRAMGSLLVMSRDEQARADQARERRDSAEEQLLAGEEIGGSQGGGGEGLTGSDFL